MAHEIDAAYLDAWYQQEKTWIDQRMAELRSAEQATLDAVSAADADFARAARSPTKTDERIAEGARQKALRNLTRIREHIAQLESALDVVGQLRATGTRVHLVQASHSAGEVIANLEPEGPTPLTPEMQLTVGDTLETGPTGMVELLSTDGATLHLGPNARLRLDVIEDDRSTYRLERGRLHFDGRCVASRPAECRAFTLATPGLTATGGAMELTLEIDHTGEQRLVVFEGDPHFRSASNGSVAVGPGLMVQMTSDGVLHGPFNMKLEWVKRWWE